MPETCNSCGEELEKRTSLRLVRDMWLDKTGDGTPGYVTATIGTFCDAVCVARFLEEQKKDSKQWVIH